MNDVEDLDLELADPPESSALVETLWQEAALARRYGDPDPAIQAYRRIIQLDPGHSEARLAAAETCRLAGRLREALMFCLDLLELDRQHVGCRLEMAESLRRLGRNDDAHAIVEILLVERPEAVPVWCGLARLLAEEGRTAGAEAVLRRALALDSAHAGSLALLGRVLARRGDGAEALDALHAAALLEPDRPGHQTALAEILTALGRFEEAEDHLERALALDDEDAPTRVARARTHLRAGRLPQAWEDFQWRRRLPGTPRPPHAAAPWEGEPLGWSHLLVHAESGLADTIDLLRFVPSLARQATHLTLLVPPPLVPLLREAGTFGTVLPRGKPLPPGLVVDFVAALEDLPGRLEVDFDTLPTQPYLAPAPHRVRRIVAPPPTRVKVGIAWSDEERPADGMPFDHVLDLTDVPGTLLFSLQWGKGADEARRHADPALITDLSPTCADLADLAGRIAQLDVVVAADGPAARLAAAMGRPVVLLLPPAGEPIWMRDRDDSPWYPTVRVLRQPAPGDWRSVVAEARTELVKAVAEREARDAEIRRRASGRAKAMSAFLAAHMQPGDLLIDVGAGDGALLLDMAETLGESLLALALEPSRPHAEMLRDTLAVCGLDEQVEVIQAAAGAASGGALASAEPRRDGARVFPLPDWVPAAIPVLPLAAEIEERLQSAACRLVVRIDQPGWEEEIIAGLDGRAAIIALEHREGTAAADRLRAAGFSLWRFADEAAGALVAFDGRTGPVLALAEGLAPAEHYGPTGLPPSPALIAAKVEEAAGIAQRGLLLHRLMRVPQAAELYALALTIDPFCAMANANLANVQHMAGKPRAAAASLRRAMTIRPHSVVRTTLAGLLREDGRLAEAEAMLLPAVEEAPEDSGRLYDLALLRRDQNRLDEAVALMRRVIAAEPGNHRRHWALAQILLGAGNLAEGLPLMGRRPVPVGRAPDLPPWRGQSPVAEMLLLEVPEEDSEAILLARFFQPLAAKGALIVVSCRAELAGLFADLPGVEQVATEDDPLPPCRYRTTLSALPLLLRIEDAARPTGTAGYLTAGRGRRAGRDDRLRVGLTWDSRRPRHACPPTALLELAGDPRLAPMALGDEHQLRFIDAEGVECMVERPMPRPRDWAEAAVLLSGLDVVVGGDTPWLHLAAALGKPTMAILPDRFDRRFPRDREDSPWYPSMRVFRPGAEGGWRGPVRRIAAALRIMAERKARL